MSGSQESKRVREEVRHTYTHTTQQHNTTQHKRNEIRTGGSSHLAAGSPDVVVIGEAKAHDRVLGVARGDHDEGPTKRVGEKKEGEKKVMWMM